MVTVGIDEVGRGCWAGPLVAGAVILSFPLEGIKDSKLLTRQQREEWALIIEAAAFEVGLGWVEAPEVDQVGLTQAVRLAMGRALANIHGPYNQIIIDGNYNFLADNPKAQAVIKADTFVHEVSAASIIAKVARDKYMIKMAETYPDYGFEHHVGYGTQLHYEKLMGNGVTVLHRRSFKPIQALLELAA